MAIIVELLNRNKRSEHRVKVDNGSATIGRSFDADLIVEDPLVSPIHCRVSSEDGLLRVDDNDSLNGVFETEKKKSKHQSLLLSSGETFCIGRSKIRVFNSDHQVAPARLESSYEQWITRASMLKSAVAAVMLFALIRLFGIYLQTATKLNFMRMANELLVWLVIPTAWFLGAALLNRLLRKESRFLALATTTYILFSLIILGGIGREVIQFNLPSLGLSMAVHQIVNYVSVFVLIAITLKVALELSNIKRYAFSGAAVILMFSLFAMNYWGNDHKNRLMPPQYRQQLLPPAFQLTGTISKDQFLNKTQALYANDKGD